MLISFSGKQIEVTDAIRRHAEEKLDKLQRYFDIIHSVEVTASLERNWHVVEITVHADGVLLRGEEKSPDMYTSIDQVVEKIERQLVKYKGKLIDRQREAAHRGVAGAEFPGTEPGLPPIAGEIEEETGRLVRTKRFAVKPMSVGEAARQMELLGHDFYVFANSDTEQVNVVYRRKDGNYGLIEPEF
jgi:putative sigma-54 modulation protein